MKTHPVCELFPEMGEEQFNELVKDIEENGLMEPILVYKGRIIDGRHRYKACKALNIEPKFEEWDGQGSIVKLVVSRNLHRRHLSTSQKAMIATDMLPMLEKEAEHRKLIKQASKDPKATKSNGATKPKHPRAARLSDHAGKVMGVSGRQVEKAKALKEKAPELAEKVRKGEMTANAANKLADASPEERKKALKKAKKTDPKTGQKVGIKKAVANLKPAKKPAPQNVTREQVEKHAGRVEKALEIVEEKSRELLAAAKQAKAIPLRTTSTESIGKLIAKVEQHIAALIGRDGG